MLYKNLLVQNIFFPDSQSAQVLHKNLPCSDSSPSSRKCFWHFSHKTISFIGQISSFPGEVEMICQTILKAFTVKLAQTKVIPVTAEVFIKTRGMSTFGAIIVFIFIVQFFANVFCAKIANVIVFYANVNITNLAQV